MTTTDGNVSDLEPVVTEGTKPYPEGTAPPVSDDGKHADIQFTLVEAILKFLKESGVPDENIKELRKKTATEIINTVMHTSGGLAESLYGAMASGAGGGPSGIDKGSFIFKGSYYSRYNQWSFRTVNVEEKTLEATLPSWWGTVSLEDLSYGVPFLIDCNGTVPQNGYGVVFPTSVTDLSSGETTMALAFAGTLSGNHHVAVVSGSDAVILVEDEHGVGILKALESITINAGATVTLSDSQIAPLLSVCDGYAADALTMIHTHFDSGYESYVISGDLEGSIEYDNGTLSYVLTNNGSSAITIGADEVIANTYFNAYFDDTSPNLIYVPSDFSGE